MSIFLQATDLATLESARNNAKFAMLNSGLRNRLRKRCAGMGLANCDIGTQYFHYAAEFLGDAAFIAAWTKDEAIQRHVRSFALDIARLPESEWIGPKFRSHAPNAPGHLETAHLSVALSLAYDLCRDLFTESEKAEIVDALTLRAIPLCRRWLEQRPWLNNWRAILISGVATPAAVLGMKSEMEYAREELLQVIGLFQDDGSYCEFLQYSNYCAWGIMYANEALTRAGMASIDLTVLGNAVKWFHYNLLYCKPLAGYGEYPRPRSFNFNDCAAIFGADPDLLAMLSCRLKETMPESASLARALFERMYGQNPQQGPFDLTSFGFVNRYGFLTLLYYPRVAVAAEKIDLPRVKTFDCGETVARTGDWGEERTALAMSCTSRVGLNSGGHIHNDLNSIQLVSRRERLLADSGHACYRNLIHEFETATFTHNTCTFLLGDEEIGQQSTEGRKYNPDGSYGPSVFRAGKFGFSGACGEVAVIINDAGAAYGHDGLIREFQRIAILCGEHALFVIDDIDSAASVRTCWNWLLNNRDGVLEFEEEERGVVARRGDAEMILRNLSPDVSVTPVRYGYIHDFYHPESNAPGTGAPGSGWLTGFTENVATVGYRRFAHAINIDGYGLTSAGQLEVTTPTHAELVTNGCRWELDAERRDCVMISEKVSGFTVKLAENNGVWTLERQ